jgi:hypothetical protein
MNRILEEIESYGIVRIRGFLGGKRIVKFKG